MALVSQENDILVDPSEVSLEVDVSPTRVDLLTPGQDVSSSALLGPGKSKQRAPVYFYFRWINEIQKYKCNLCGAAYPHHQKSPSSVLNGHFELKHPEEFNEMREKSGKNKSQGDTEGQSEENQPLEVTPEGFRVRLLDFIISTNQPFALVEDETFEELLHYVSQNHPCVELPSRKSLREWIKTSYKTERELLKRQLQMNEGKVSLITDCWTSSNQNPFMGVIATWIDENWEMQTCLLDFILLEGPHTGENCAFALAKTLDAFQLWPKLMAITTDNAANMGTMFQKLDEIAVERGCSFSSCKHRVRCLAHVINLACKALMAGIDGKMNDKENFTDENGGAVSKLRSIVNGIRATPQRRFVYFSVCDQENQKKRLPKLDIRIRWNSTFGMLVRAREQKKAFIKTVESIADLRQLVMSEAEWLRIDYLISMLKIFKETTVTMSRDRPTLADTTVAYQLLFSHLEKYIENPKTTSLGTSRKRARKTDTATYPDWVVNAAKKSWEKLQEYYPYSDLLVYVAATILDPRRKLMWYKALEWESSWQKNAKQAIVSLWESEYNTRDVEPEPQAQPSSSKSAVDESGISFIELINEKMKSFQQPDDELRKYLSEPVESSTALPNGVLGWWKVNACQFPKLSKMAKDILSIHGTGVAVERLFSCGPDLLSHRRQQLSPSSIIECISLNNWNRRKKTPKKFKADIDSCHNLKLFGTEDAGEASDDEFDVEA